MAASAIHEHGSINSPMNALHLSQKAPGILSRPVPSTKIFPLSLIDSSESPEIWTEYEQLFLACLRTGDDKSAHLCLERLSARFGATNERVMGLRGLYQEAIAQGSSDLEEILKEYNKILSDNLVNVPILKRRVALLQSMQRTTDALTCLVDYLEHFPTDVEGWVQLSELYQSQGMFPQAIFSLEEALLITSNAWNLHTRLGELNVVAAAGSSEGSEQARTYLIDALQRFSRSIELCDDYLRGLYGLKITCEKLQKAPRPSKSQVEGPSPETLKRLDNLATEKLTQIVKSWSKDSPHSKYNEAEIIAAKELLNRQ